MILARVVGDVVATVMNDHLRNNRMLLVEPVDLDGNASGPEFLALDVVGAGAGDQVLVLKEGGGARILFADDQIPLQTVVVAIVDHLEVESWARQELEALQAAMETPSDIEALVERVTKSVLARMQGTDGWAIGRSSCDGCVGCHHCVARRGPKIDRMLAAGADRFGSGPGLKLKAELAGLARAIDHTLLKPDATRQEVEKLCAEAAEHHFASVCVNPCWVQLCATLLAGVPEVKVCTVVGFPLGATSTYSKGAETQAAIVDGAREIDMVINIGALKSGDLEYVQRDIHTVVDCAQPKAIVKVILETALLTDEEKVAGCKAAMAAGAHFVKTSTGFSKAGATAHDIALMRGVVGARLGVKASGGVRDQKTALEMIEAGADRIGASASVAIVLGAREPATGY